MRFRNPLTADEVYALLIETGAIQSSNYDGPDAGETFADAGTRLDLTTGNMTSTGVVWDGVTGSLTIRGNLTAAQLTLLHPTLGSTVAVMGVNALFGANTPALLMDFPTAPNDFGSLAWNGDPTFGAAYLSASVPGGSEARVTVRSSSAPAGSLIALSGGGSFASFDQTGVSIRSAAGTVVRLQGTAAGQVVEVGLNAALWATLNVQTSAGTITADANGVWVPGALAFRFGTYGGGWFMSDTTWIRSLGAKNVYCDAVLGTVHFSALLGGGRTINVAGSGFGSVTYDAAFGGSVGASGIVHATNQIISGYAQQNIGAARNWTGMHIRAQSQGAGGNNSAGFVAWVPGIAPVWDTFETGGERWRAINNPNTAHIPIEASAFTVISTERAKSDVRKVAGVELLDRCAQIEAHRYRMRVRPQTLRPTPRFADVNARWVERGHTPLTITPDHVESHDHDCAIDTCAGTPEQPCMIAANDTERFGLIAEQVHAIAPEVVHLDEHGQPLGLDVDQVAALALAGVGELARQLVELRRLITQV